MDRPRRCHHWCSTAEADELEGGERDASSPPLVTDRFAPSVDIGCLKIDSSVCSDVANLREGATLFKTNTETTASAASLSISH